MLATTLRRTAASKRALPQLQSQRRHGGSLSKNKHIEVRPKASCVSLTATEQCHNLAVCHN